MNNNGRLLRKCSATLCGVSTENASFPQSLWGPSTQRAATPQSLWNQAWRPSRARSAADKNTTQTDHAESHWRGHLLGMRDRQVKPALRASRLRLVFSQLWTDEDTDADVDGDGIFIPLTHQVIDSAGRNSDYRGRQICWVTEAGNNEEYDVCVMITRYRFPHRIIHNDTAWVVP